MASFELISISELNFMPKTRSMVIRVPEPCSRVIKVSLLSALIEFFLFFSELLSTKGKKVSPTHIGKKFYQTCLTVIAKLEQSKADIEQTLNPDSGHLEISVATTTNSFHIHRRLGNVKLLACFGETF
jgi:hypothetical protein